MEIVNDDGAPSKEFGFGFLFILPMIVYYTKSLYF